MTSSAQEMGSEEIEIVIAEISARLKGPGVSNIDRQLLNADRHDLRAILLQRFANREER